MKKKMMIFYKQWVENWSMLVFYAPVFSQDMFQFLDYIVE